MGFMAEYLAHQVQLDPAALCHGHPQLRHLSTALATACRALHRSAAWGRWGWSGDTQIVPVPFRWLSVGTETPSPPLARSLLPGSEIDVTLAGLESLARVFDPPVSPRSPAREQVRAPTARRDLHSEESTSPVPPCCSKNIHAPPQGFLSSDPDLELLLNKISTVNHLLSSLEKKVPDPTRWCRGRHSSPSPKSPLCQTELWWQLRAPSYPSAPSTVPVSPAGAEVTAGNGDKAQPGTAQRGHGSPACCQAPGRAGLRGEAGDTPVSLPGRAGVVTAPEPHPRVQVKAGKCQRAALTVDVESGTVTVTKRGSSSAEEVIPHHKSKGLFMASFGAAEFPATGTGRGHTLCHTPNPVPHCHHHSVLQLIKNQSVQSKVRLLCARENQKSLSRDFIFPSARVSGTSPAWGNLGTANQRSQA